MSRGNTPGSVRGAVLAGGAASRFGGKPKGLQEVGGERILDRVVRTVGEAVGEPPLVVANADNAHTWAPGLVVAKDLVTGCGSLGGIYSVVARSPDPVLIAAWDMPFLNAKLLGALIAGAGDFDVFLPESTGPLGHEPLCGVYKPACARPIKAALDHEDFQTSSFHDHVSVGILPLIEVEKCGDPDILFFNVNSPDDVTKAEQLWKSQFA